MDPMKKGVGFYARVIHNQLQKKANAYLKDVGLTQAQGDILRFICICQKEGNPIKQKDIEEYFHISNPAVSGVLDRLEQKQLTLRRKFEGDRRIHFIEPTEKGIELQCSMVNMIREHEENLMKGIDGDLQAAGMEFLSQVFENLAAADFSLKREHE